VFGAGCLMTGGLSMWSNAADQAQPGGDAGARKEQSK
jgi:hypothetical protein